MGLNHLKIRRNYLHAENTGLFEHLLLILALKLGENQ